ncbi:Aste57867_1718 [Aphanomyces stellatus]|uniref:Aste57867_1718 protein n=1 Tax=Aphanomyces stellatus TaxID=120398 RepID=A0A485KBA4_9STRA|nr:hypothetical protein As57867_001716 [Aphanomyces stellatus]VFT78929.1 Aste57867_1718 [Aphanomyces stellatus]
MFHWLLTYWKVVVPTKSTAELDAEHWLFVLTLDGLTYFPFLCFLFNRWWLLFFCVLANFSAGSVLAFNSIYDVLDVYFYGSQTKQSVKIGLQAYIWLGVAAALAGPIIERRGPRTGMALATMLISVGFVQSQLGVSTSSPTFLMIGYGVFCGAGFGVALVTTMSIVQKWFPDLRGLVSGVCMCAFGMGNTAFSFVYVKALHRGGILDPVTDCSHIPQIFWTTGLPIVVVLVLTTFVIRTPPPTYIVNGHDIHCVPKAKAVNSTLLDDEYLKVGMTLVNYDIVAHTELDGTDVHYFQQVKALSLLQCIFSTDFLFLYIAFAASIIPAQIFATELAAIGLGVFKQSLDATNHLMTQGFVSNTVGRLVVPLLSDALIRVFYANPAFARKTIFVVFLTIQVIFMAIEASANGVSYSTFRALGLTTVFASGGNLALLPCFITDMFGVYHAGTMYGLALSCWSIRAVVVGYGFANFHVTRESLGNQLQWMFVLSTVGFVTSLFIRTNSGDRFFHGYRFSIGRTVVFQYALAWPASSEDAASDDDSSITILDRYPPTNSPSTEVFMLWKDTKGVSDLK